MAYALEIQDVHKVFNRGTINEKVALNGVNLNLNPGDFVTIIGGNGAGKSTTLNAIAGVWPIDSGKIIIDGTDITNLPEHKRAKYLGRVFQDPMTGTAATMDIEENMAIALRRGEKRTLRWGVSREDRELFREKLQTLGLGLEDRMTSKVGLLSGGQRQAITLLMAALKQPKLLLLDEHTAALDPKTAAKVLEISDKIIAENQLTAMMVTHNMKDAIVHGNRLIMMHEGKVIYDVAGEVPTLDALKGSKVYILREKLNNGGQMNREEKDWLTEKVNSNTYFKSAVPLQGWRFDFSDILRTYIVKQYGHWAEYKATDKTALRNFLYGRIDSIVELNK